LSASDPLARQVAWGSRILAMAGHGDLTLGHLSARRGDAVLMKRKGVALEEVTPDDVVTIGLDAKKVAGEGNVHLEAVLHTEVYRARPDVGAVAHTHPEHATALAGTSADLLAVSHDGVLFAGGLARFDDTADLITSADQGRALARALGSRRGALMKNHGALVVGKSVPWAVLAALTLERAARIQGLAAALGAPSPIPPGVAEAMIPHKYRDDFVEEYWAYWIRALRRRGLADDMPEDAA
jgi:L-fuculose-phosphate aldolase